MAGHTTDVRRPSPSPGGYYLQVGPGGWAGLDAKLHRMDRTAARAGVRFVHRWRPDALYAGRLPGTALPWYVPVRRYRIDATLPRLAGDFRALGTLDHTGDSVRVVPLDPTIVPAHFADDNGGCDHCLTHRRRRLTYLLGDANGHVHRIGSSCLVDFVGYRPEQLLRFVDGASALQGAACGAVEPGSDAAGRRYRTEDALALGAALVRRDGYVPGSRATPERPATSRTLSAMLLGRSAPVPAPLRADDSLPGDHGVAALALERASRATHGPSRAVRYPDRVAERTALDEFLDPADTTRLGVLLALVSAASAAPRWTNAPIGRVGEPVELAVRIVRRVRLHRDDGSLWRLHARHVPSGRLLQWVTGSAPATGAVSSLQGVVGAHRSRFGLVRTELARARTGAPSRPAPPRDDDV